MNILFDVCEWKKNCGKTEVWSPLTDCNVRTEITDKALSLMIFRIEENRLRARLSCSKAIRSAKYCWGDTQQRLWSEISPSQTTYLITRLIQCWRRPCLQDASRERSGTIFNAHDHTRLLLASTSGENCDHGIDIQEGRRRSLLKLCFNDFWKRVMKTEKPTLQNACIIER